MRDYVGRMAAFNSIQLSGNVGYTSPRMLKKTLGTYKTSKTMLHGCESVFKVKVKYFKGCIKLILSLEITRVVYSKVRIHFACKVNVVSIVFVTSTSTCFPHSVTD